MASLVPSPFTVTMSVVTGITPGSSADDYVAIGLAVCVVCPLGEQSTPHEQRT